MNSTEEDGFPDFTNLLLLAECACACLPSSSPPCKSLRAPSLPLSSPPCKKLRGPGPPSSSLPCKRLSSPSCKRLCGPGPPSTTPPCKKLRGPRPPSSSLPCKRLSSPSCKRLCGPGPPSTSPPWKKLRGPRPPSSPLPYEKLCGPEAPPPITWREAHVRLKGTTPLFFGQKLLTSTDIEVHFNRLAIPKEMIGRIMSSNVMTDEEKAEVTSGNEGFHVLVLDRMGRTWRLVFKYWWSSKTYVMNGEWKHLVKENGLRANVDFAQLWAFRVGGPNGPLRFVVA